MEKEIKKLFPKSYITIYEDSIYIDLKIISIKKKELLEVIKKGLNLKRILNKEIIIYYDNLEIIVKEDNNIDVLHNIQQENILLKQRLEKREKALKVKKEIVEKNNIIEKLTRLKRVYKNYTKLEKEEIFNCLKNNYFNKDYLYTNLQKYKVEKVKILSKKI